jgi:hypothetical protein
MKQTKTPYETATWAKRKDISQDMQEALNGSLRAFLENGGDINERDIFNNTILHRLIRTYNDQGTSAKYKVIIAAKIIELISMGADLTLTNAHTNNTQALSVKKSLLKAGLLSQLSQDTQKEQIVEQLIKKLFQTEESLLENYEELKKYDSFNHYITKALSGDLEKFYIEEKNNIINTLPTDVIPIISSYFENDDLYELNVRHYDAHYNVQIEPGDGNCLFHAVARQLNNGITHEQLRARVIEYYNSDNINTLNLHGELTLHAQINHTVLNDENYNEQLASYIDYMAQNAIWGGQPEMQAIANIFNRSIVVHRPSSPDTIINPTHDGQIQGTIHLQYVGGMHYNSLIPVNNAGAADMGETTSESEVDSHIEESQQDALPKVLLTPNISDFEEDAFFEIFGIQAQPTLPNINEAPNMFLTPNTSDFKEEINPQQAVEDAFFEIFGIQAQPTLQNINDNDFFEIYGTQAQPILPNINDFEEDINPTTPPQAVQDNGFPTSDIIQIAGAISGILWSFYGEDWSNPSK